MNILQLQRRNMATMWNRYVEKHFNTKVCLSNYQILGTSHDSFCLKKVLKFDQLYESESVSCSVLSDFATSWTVAHQASLSVGFSRQEWVAISFCRRSSQPRDWMHVFQIAGSFFTLWATWEVVAKSDLSLLKILLL